MLLMTRPFRSSRVRRVGFAFTAAAGAAGTILALALPSAANAFSCGGTATAGLFGNYGPVSGSHVAVFGNPNYSQGYSFHVGGNIDTPVSVEVGNGNGWTQLNSKGPSGGGSVFWGNIVNSPKIRVMSLSINSVPVYWEC